MRMQFYAVHEAADNRTVTVDLGAESIEEARRTLLDAFQHDHPPRNIHGMPLPSLARQWRDPKQYDADDLQKELGLPAEERWGSDKFRAALAARVKHILFVEELWDNQHFDWRIVTLEPRGA